MTRNPAAWRRIVTVCGVLGLALTIAGFITLEEKLHGYRTPGLLSFYGGFTLLIAAIVLWYRYVPPRPPALDEPEEVPEDSEDPGEV